MPNDMTYDRAGFVRRCLSASYAPAEGEPGYEALSGALGTLFDHFAEGGRLTLGGQSYTLARGGRKAPIKMPKAVQGDCTAFDILRIERKSNSFH